MRARDDAGVRTRKRAGSGVMTNSTLGYEAPA